MASKLKPFAPPNNQTAELQKQQIIQLQPLARIDDRSFISV
jgi:hypothetical protein